MPRKTYNKLIRDRIPEIIEKHGGKAKIRTLSDTEFRKALLDKLAEEAEECAGADNEEDIKDELADVLELLHALAKEHNTPFADIEQRKKEKSTERGGFARRLFLEYVDE